MPIARLVSRLAILGVAAACGGDRDSSRDSAPPMPPGVERIDRCTVRVLPATAESRAALIAAAREQLAGVKVEAIELSLRGDRIRSFVVSGAPVPATPPTTETDAAALAREAMTRYGAVVGVAAGDLQHVAFHRFLPRSIGEVAWSMAGELAGTGRPRSRIHVLLEASGAVRSILVKEGMAVPPPGTICEEPRVALDDPRIRRAVVGQTVKDSPPGSEPRTIVFTEADVGDIGTEVMVQQNGEVFRRVITVGLKERWTAHLDADTAALIGITPNFWY